MNIKFVAAIFIIAMAIAFIVFPFSVVQAIPTDSPQPYVFKARIVEKLGETLDGFLQYFLVESIEGNSPETEFVVCISEAYSRGVSNVNLEKDKELWMQGSLMSREAFFGEQYLFFGYPQLYIRQIKEKGFWPDQITELKILYLSPATSLFFLIYAWRLPLVFAESGFEFGILFISKIILILATIFLLFKNRKKPWNLALIILAYAFLSMILTVPMLTELY